MRYKKGVAQRTNTAPRLPASADATQEYRGEVIEIVRAPSLAPMAVNSNAPPKRPPPRRSPDASLEFPHPVDPALFEDAEDSHELPPDFEDELPPPRPDRSRVRYVMFTGVMVLAGILFGLAIGSRSKASVASEGDTTTESKPITKKTAELPAMTAPTSTTTTATATTAKAAATVGTITSPKWVGGRSVYMDGGKNWGKAGSVEVPCGTHVVQIGAQGKPRKVNVPCGGSVSVLP